VWVSADYLQVGFPLALTQRLMRTFDARWPGNVPTDGRGVIRDFDILIDADREFAGTRARFEDLEVLEWGRWPALGRVDGSADLMLGQGNGRITGEQVRFEWPRNFRAPLVADVAGCELEVLWSGRDWQIDVGRCPLSNEFISLDGRARFRRSEGKPVVAIDAAADRADLAGLAPYLPASVMKPRVIDWVGRALAAGEATDIRFSLHGDMDDFPFRERQGSLEARFDFAGATIDYQPGWPAAREASGTATFRGAAMRLEGRIGDLAGAPVNRVTARIDDFQQARLRLDYDTTAELPELAGFITASPLLDDSEFSLERFRFEGPAEIGGALDLPLGDTPGELAVTGAIVLAGNEFEELRSGTRLESLAGRLEFDREGFRGDDLDALYAGFPGRLDLAAEWAADEPFQARLAGRFPASLLVAVSPLVDDPLLAHIEGQSDWAAELTVTRPGEAGEKAEIWLDLASDLEGVSIGLPPPLDKVSGESWPLSVRYPVQSAEPVVLARLDQRLELRAERALTPVEPGAPPVPELRSADPATGSDTGEPSEAAIRRLSIQLGPGEAEMPPPGFFALHGAAAEVDLDRWMREMTAYFSDGRERGRLELSEVEFSAGRLTLLNRVFDDARVDIDYRDGVLQAYLEAPAIAGRVRYHRAEGGAHSLHAEMQRLYLPRASTGATLGRLDPTDLPELHLFIDDLRYGDMDLGDTRIEAFPVADGLRFDSVESTTDFMNFQARGDWLTGDEGERSDFDIVMTSESLGSLVEALDLSSVLQGGQTMVRYNAWWPGSPAAFGLARLNGEMTFSVIDGKILTADAGAGRLLGLISVTALPRRLALDFRDVFESGFSFDQASGTLRLESGTAYTNDFVLESTAATLAIEGSSDLVNQEFDYRLSVRPGVSQALPVIGAIAGGPTGAAAGLALQGLLRDALGEAAEARYSIRGRWTEP
ncbi:MAG: AsmA-like C-terminal region-containing protein, partial [Gammaproteobacteria bacterium]